MTKKIAWERWIDFDEEESEEITTGDDIDNMETMKLVPILVRTPLGMFNPKESMAPCNMFDCWIGHTNFPLTVREKSILDNVEGIEILRIMSRYRFFIGIGKLFSLTEVRPRVELALEIGRESTIQQIMEEIGDEPVWAVGIYADGKYKIIFPEDDSDFDEDIINLEQSGTVNIIRSTEFGV